MPDQQPRTFAVVLKTHVWDEFVERQLARLRSYCGDGTLIVLADESAGPLEGIPHDRVVRLTTEKLVAMGLADASPRGNLIWWNTDYPNYYLRREADAFDYYVFVEYDAAVLAPLDDVVAEVAARELDFVTLPTREDRVEWHWTRLHEQVYPGDALKRSLNCVSVFSARAVDLLLARRLEMTAEYHDGRLAFWPMNEVFVASEMARAGYRTASLAEFGDVGRYHERPALRVRPVPVPPTPPPAVDRPRSVPPPRVPPPGARSPLPLGRRQGQQRARPQLTGEARRVRRRRGRSRRRATPAPARPAASPATRRRGRGRRGRTSAPLRRRPAGRSR